MGLLPPLRERAGGEALLVEALTLTHRGEDAAHLAGCLILVTFRGEVHAEAVHVLVARELLGGSGAVGLYANLERAEAFETYGVGVLELGGHHLYELLEYRLDVRLLDGTVVLDDLGELVGAEGVEDYGAAVIQVLRLLTVVAVNFYEY